MRRVCAVGGVVLALAFARAADGPTEATITDAEGKAVKVSELTFTTGTRRLAWLADPADDAKKGPLVLEMREPHSTSLKVGVVTYVPVSSVESIKYDYDKLATGVAVKVKGVTEPVAGTLQYKGINVLGLGGTAEGESMKFIGGTLAKGGIKAVAFPNAKPLPARKAGTPWAIQIDQKAAMDPTLKASNVKFLYRFPGGEELADAATVRKGDPLKLDESVTAFTPVAVDQNTHMAAVEVQIGGTDKVVVLPLHFEKDGKMAVLVGLLGEVDAGWKLFPLHTIKSMKRQKKD